MAETIVTIPAAELDRLVYVAIAEARNDAETELLAGLADRILQARPNIAPGNLTAAIAELQEQILKMPDFQDEQGRFIGEERYKQLLQGAQLSPPLFEEEVRPAGRGSRVSKRTPVLAATVSIRAW